MVLPPVVLPPVRDFPADTSALTPEQLDRRRRLFRRQREAGVVVVSLALVLGGAIPPAPPLAAEAPASVTAPEAPCPPRRGCTVPRSEPRPRRVVTADSLDKEGLANLTRLFKLLAECDPEPKDRSPA